jgi:integrase
MKTTLIPATINAAIKGGTAATLNDAEPGLRLWIGTGGTATWQWRSRDAQGRVRTFPLGHYPHIGLAEARRLSRQMAYEVRFKGADPVAQARARRASAAAPKGHTLTTLFDLYGAQVGHTIKSWAAQMRPQIARVFRSHLDTPLAALSVGQLQLTVDGYPKPISAGFGARCLLTVLRWATAPGRAYVDRSMLELRPPAVKANRDRVLSREELVRLLPALRADASAYAGAMRLILFTAARRGEVDAARWRDIDFRAGTWTMPTSKNGTRHVVPLPRQAIALLRSLAPEDADPESLVFKTRGKSLHAWDGATARLQAASDTAGWHRHDLRRTAATMLGELGVMPPVIEACLNHTAIHSRLAATYNKSRYRPEVAAAFQRLADALDGIEQGAAEVIHLRARDSGSHRNVMGSRNH